MCNDNVITKNNSPYLLITGRYFCNSHIIYIIAQYVIIVIILFVDLDAYKIIQLF